MNGHAHRRATDRPVRNYYTNPNDAAKYLNQSLIRYKEEPCYILVHLHNTPDGPCYMGSLYPDSSFAENKKIATVPLDCPDLDISSPPLGYANILNKREDKLTVVYVSRIPYQMWKQGVTYNNCMIMTIDGKMSNTPAIDTPGFFDSIKGIFPKFYDAIKVLEDGKIGEIAISRDVAFERRRSGLISVYHKTREFGLIQFGSDGRPYIATNNELIGWAIKRNNPDLDIRPDTVRG